MSSNLIFHTRMKHIKIDFHYVCDQVLQNKLEVSFLSTRDQIANLVTKPLAIARFHLLWSNLHVQELPFRLRGRIETHESSANNAIENQEYYATINVVSQVSCKNRGAA